MENKYWVYSLKILTFRGKQLQAKLIDPSPQATYEQRIQTGYWSQQKEPYGIDLNLTYQTNSNGLQPDYYFDNAGFNLFSERLVSLMFSFGVRGETFPIKMVDKSGKAQPHLQYYVFHIMEGLIDAMDEVASDWTGECRTGVPKLILDYTKFEHRPIFVCDKVHVQLIRDDLKKAIQKEKITGFRFHPTEKYHSGKYGMLFEYEE